MIIPFFILMTSLFDSAITHGLFFQLLISLLFSVHHALHQAPVSQTFLQYLQIYQTCLTVFQGGIVLAVNIIKCNQAHAVFKYNFVVTGKSAVCISNFMPLSQDGCWSNFHLVYKILFLPFDWSTKFISSTQPIRCKMTIYVKPIRA